MADGFYLPDFWHELDDLAGLGGDSRILGGDFNVTIWSSWEKSRPYSNRQYEVF